ncbi:MAG: hypothetical protein AB8B65_11600 [Kordia sp.]|uniref:hypothetical protein n=1 Tax=Kordia sp. TaxID=1965332 RepID=UPI00385DA530
MTYIQALDYVLRKGYTAYQISKKSSLPISTLNRMLEQKTNPQEKNKITLIEFVEKDIEDTKEDDRDVFLDRLETEAEDNWEDLKKRGSFKKMILIEVLKVIIKAQNMEEKSNTDLTELIKNADIDTISNQLVGARKDM